MKRETELREQEAPEKNTDRAFVKVKKDGTPELPGQKKEQKTEGKNPPDREPRK